jgi:phosphatidylserine/phosphatidylglycerophosphate/cardiolipin synthase-like enzyme
VRRVLLVLAMLGACAAAAQTPEQGAQVPVSKQAPVLPDSRTPPALPGSQTPPALPGSQTPPALPARGTVQLAFTPWDNAEAMIVEAIRGAKQQILVQAFSFTSRALASALIAAKRRGLEVQVLADREQAYSGESSRIPELANAGIAVTLDVRYQSAHNKVMIIDAGAADAAVITGSYNWTYAAQYKNAENVLILRGNPDIVSAYAANWRRHRADALPYAEQ